MSDFKESTSRANQARTPTPTLLAQHWHLTERRSAGKTTWRGPNPFPGAEPGEDRFCLYESCAAYDFHTQEKYSPQKVFALYNGASATPSGTPTAPRPQRAARAQFDWRAPFETYRYRDETGLLLFEVCRQGDGAKKRIAQRRPNPNFGPKNLAQHVYSLGDVRRVLFHLHAVVEAHTVFVVEGEKAAQFLNDLLHATGYSPGVCATCNPHGAGKWLPEYSESVRGKSVYIVPDNDDAGQKHATAVAASVASVAQDVRIVDLPDQPEKAGADDWLARGNRIEELLALAQLAQMFTVPSAQVSDVLPDEFPLDDIGNGMRFAAMHGADLRFCSTRDAWIVFRRGVWELDATGAVETRAKDTARATLAKARGLSDEDAKSRLSRHALTLCKRASRATMIADAASEPGMMVCLSMFDESPHLFNCKNGTYDLATREFREHRAADLLSLQSPAVYDRGATCLLWGACMERWIPDEATRIYLQDSVGLTLSGETRDEFFNFIHGDGGNGKSKFLGTLETLLGSYGHKTQAETLMAARDARKSEAPSPAILSLRGARMVTAHEIDSQHRVASALLKDLTGRDAITARGLYERRSTTFTPQFTLWLVGNSKPAISDTSAGMWRRVRLVEFGAPIAPHERDYQLSAKLERELPGILNWALEGLARVQRRGVVVPDAVLAATAEYRAEQDPLGAFLSECCELGANLSVTSAALWKAWETWCKENGEALRNPKFIHAELTRRKCENVSSTLGRTWKGVSLTKSFLEVASVVSVVSVDTEDEQPTRPTRPTPLPAKVATTKTTPVRATKAQNADSEPYGAS